LGASVAVTFRAKREAPAPAPIVTRAEAHPESVTEKPVLSVSVAELPAIAEPLSIPSALSRGRATPSARAPRAGGNDGPVPCRPNLESPCREAAQPTFAEEVALASEARAALESGDISSCLRAVTRHDERFRTGVFAQEIDVIRI